MSPHGLKNTTRNKKWSSQSRKEACRMYQWVVLPLQQNGWEPSNLRTRWSRPATLWEYALAVAETCSHRVAAAASSFLLRLSVTEAPGFLLCHLVCPAEALGSFSIILWPHGDTFLIISTIQLHLLTHLHPLYKELHLLKCSRQLYRLDVSGF